MSIVPKTAHRNQSKANRADEDGAGQYQKRDKVIKRIEMCNRDDRGDDADHIHQRAKRGSNIMTPAQIEHFGALFPHRPNRRDESDEIAGYDNLEFEFGPSITHNDVEAMSRPIRISNNIETITNSARARSMSRWATATPTIANAHPREKS